MATTKTEFVSKSLGFPRECRYECDACDRIDGILAWLTSLLSTYQACEVLNFHFSTEQEPGRNCTFCIAQIRYRV
jgi:hypothetical protein